MMSLKMISRLGGSVSIKEENLLRYAWNVVESKDWRKINNDIDAVIVNKVTKADGSKMNVQYTLFVIAIMCRDLELVRRLLTLGASLNIEHQFEDEKEFVTPLYYATALKDADVVKLLVESGADVEKYRGRKQSTWLKSPEEEKYSIFELERTDVFRPFYGDWGRPTASYLTLVQLYIDAGVKLNSTPWGPCMLYG